MPQETNAAVAGATTPTVVKETIEAIDKVVKPLIESAAEEAGPILGGLSKVLGAAVGVVVELATAPATARDEDLLPAARDSSEHKKDARPSTEQKHEDGAAGAFRSAGEFVRGALSTTSIPTSRAGYAGAGFRAAVELIKHYF